MLKLIYILIQWLKPPQADREADGDPLSHPAIRAMNPDELADLPIATARQPRAC